MQEDTAVLSGGCVNSPLETAVQCTASLFSTPSSTFTTAVSSNGHSCCKTSSTSSKKSQGVRKSSAKKRRQLSHKRKLFHTKRKGIIKSNSASDSNHQHFTRGIPADSDDSVLSESDDNDECVHFSKVSAKDVRIEKIPTSPPKRRLTRLKALRWREQVAQRDRELMTFRRVLQTESSSE